MCVFVYVCVATTAIKLPTERACVNVRTCPCNLPIAACQAAACVRACGQSGLGALPQRQLPLACAPLLKTATAHRNACAGGAGADGAPMWRLICIVMRGDVVGKGINVITIISRNRSALHVPAMG